MKRIVLGLGLVLAAVAVASAQPAAGSGSAAAPKQKKIDYKLQPKPSKDFPNGKVSMVEGTAVKDPHHLFLENLEIMQPVAVTVLTKDANHDVKLQLGKHDWTKDFSREGSTKGKGFVTYKLRTAGDLKILVSSPDAEPRPFQLVVYVGEYVKPQLTPVAVKKSAWKAPANTPAKPGSAAAPAAAGGAKSDDGGSNTGIIVAIVLVGLMIVVTMVVLNRRKR